MNKYALVYLLLCWGVPLACVIGQTDAAPQLAIPGDFLPPFENLNNVLPAGLDLNEDAAIDIVPPCSCRGELVIQNGAAATEGLFDDQIIVASGVSGQQWFLENSANVLDPLTLNTLSAGTPIPEVGNTGIYVLPIAHKSDLGYFAFVHAPMVDPSVVLGPITNTCYYPNAKIENLSEVYCDSEAPITLFGTASSGFDDNITDLVPISTLWKIERLDDGAVFNTNIFDPTTLGTGDYKVSYTFGGDPTPFYTDNKTGCSTTVEAFTTIRPPQLMACNSSVNITLPPSSCEVQVVPAILLTTNVVTDDLFEISVIGPQGQNLGDVVPAEFAGLPLIGDIRDLCSGQNCLTDIMVNDLAAPVINLPADITLTCAQDTDPIITGMASASDCSDISINYADESVQTLCGNPKVVITRTWVATDAFGNTSEAAQRIEINRAAMEDFRFPRDTIFECSDVQADPSITQATATGAGLPNLVELPICGLFYVHEDDTIGLCGDPSTNYVIVREWTVLEECGFQPIDMDGEGKDNIQLIRVLDQTGPSINASSFPVFTNLSPDMNGIGNCSSTGFIPPADLIIDGCNDYTYTILTPIGEAEYTNGVDGQAGGFIPFPGLPIGVHTITYRAADDCGNVTSEMVEVTVLDNNPPLMICENMLSLVLTSDGNGRIFPFNIDRGIRDDCCEGDIRMKIEGESDAAFRPFIDFFCDNDTIPVVVRAWDCYGNFNDCTADVIVEDRVPPFVAVAVDDVSLTCQDDFDQYLDSAFDAPEFGDNCNFSLSFSMEEEIDSCGIGTLTRTWTARDNPNNPPAVFTQVVQLEAVHSYRFSVPSDATVACNVTTFDDIEVLSTSCDLLDISVMEEVVSVPEDTACLRILRTHQIVNWCEYDGSSEPIELPRWDGIDLNTLTGDSYVAQADGIEIFREGLTLSVDIGPSSGYYQYQQIITVYDDVPPEVNAIGESVFCVPADFSGESCFGEVNFPVSITDNCTDSVEVIQSLYLNNQSVVNDIYGELMVDGSDEWRVVGTYPIGNHAFIFSVFDDCGNFGEYFLPFSVEDCTAPTFVCPDTFRVELPIEQSIALSPNDILTDLSDNCGVASLAFDPSFVQLDRAVSCQDIGYTTLEIWVRDFADNRSTCSVVLEAQDADGTCIGFFDIGGFVLSQNGDPLGDVETKLTGPSVGDSYQTDTEGAFTFSSMREGGPYTITPLKDTDHGNGVNVLDLLLVTRHILAVLPLDSPYKVIAADVDRSGSVSVADLIAIRRVILTVDSVFQGNTSWRIVPESFVFANPTNPLQENFPESSTIFDLNQDTYVNFVGIKTGDVDNTAIVDQNLQSIEPRNLGTTSLSYIDRQWERGAAFETEFSIAAEALEGFQLELGMDASILDNIRVIPGAGMEAVHFNTNYLDSGHLPICWTAQGTVDTVRFSLQATTSRLSQTQDLIWISQAQLRPLAYHKQDEIKLEARKLVLRAIANTPTPTEWSLFENYPNPFVSKTNINFYLAESCEVQLSISDFYGNIMYQQQKSLAAGNQTISLDRSVFGAAGVYAVILKVGNT
ncbi:MAG: T9SS type A sorting domain-containing protein, partial [Bacteroidota bacterium]